MQLANYLFYFMAGGAVVTAVVALEESGLTMLSRLAALFPIITWLSYLFIGQFAAPQQVADHATFVLFGTLVSWVPYMATIIYFSPRVGVLKAVALALAVFVVIAAIFTRFYFAH